MAGWTKQQLIEEAYNELALAGHVFDLNANLREAALRALDTMMATMLTIGIDIGYALPVTPDASNIDDDAGIADGDVEAVYMNLATKLAARHGKSLTSDTRTAAQRGYNRLLGTAVTPISPQCSGLPLVGAGNKPTRGM
jgi:hypothetical protein